MLVFWISMLYIVSVTMACDPSPGWRAIPMIERINDSSIAIIATVTEKTDGSGGAPCSSDTICGYWVNAIVKCVIKDDTGSISVNSNVKIAGFGDNSDCTITNIVLGHTIENLILLEPHENMYKVNELNWETGSERVSRAVKDRYVNEFPDSVCYTTTLAPTTTNPTTTERRQTTRRSSTHRQTSSKMSTTIAMKEASTKANKNSRNRGTQDFIIDPTTSTSTRNTFSFITFTLVIFTLFGLII